MPKRFAIPALSTLGILGLSVGLSSGLGACLPRTAPGGHAWSLDKHVYASSVWAPKTVSLTDTTSGETLWVREVPVGKQVVIRFFKDEAEGDDPRRPDQMVWGMADYRKSADGWEGRMDVPGRNWRMLSFDLRPAPEYPRAEAPVEEPLPLDPPPPADSGDAAEDGGGEG